MGRPFDNTVCVSTGSSRSRIAQVSVDFAFGSRDRRYDFGLLIETLVFPATAVPCLECSEFARRRLRRIL